MVCDVCGKAMISAFYGVVQLRFILKEARLAHTDLVHKAVMCLQLGFRYNGHLRSVFITWAAAMKACETTFQWTECLSIHPVYWNYYFLQSCYPDPMGAPLTDKQTLCRFISSSRFSLGSLKCPGKALVGCASAQMHM